MRSYGAGQQDKREVFDRMGALLGSPISYHLVANGRSLSQCALLIFLLNVSISGKKILNVKRCRVYGPDYTPFSHNKSHIWSMSAEDTFGSNA